MHQCGGPGEGAFADVLGKCTGDGKRRGKGVHADKWCCTKNKCRLALGIVPAPKEDASQPQPPQLPQPPQPPPLPPPPTLPPPAQAPLPLLPPPPPAPPPAQALSQTLAGLQEQLGNQMSLIQGLVQQQVSLLTSLGEQAEHVVSLREGLAQQQQQQVYMLTSLKEQSQLVVSLRDHLDETRGEVEDLRVKLSSFKQRRVQGDRVHNFVEFKRDFQLTVKTNPGAGNNCLAYALGATDAKGAQAMRRGIHDKLIAGLEEHPGRQWCNHNGVQFTKEKVHHWSWNPLPHVTKN